MKKTLVLALVGLLASAAAHAGGNVGQCVYPKTKTAKNGYLEFKQLVYVFSSPDGVDKQPLTSLSAFTVKAEKAGYVQLATVADFSQPDKEAGRVIGWAKLSDFKVVPLRNCN